MRVDAEKCASDGSEEKPHPIFIVDTQGKSEDSYYLLSTREDNTLNLSYLRGATYAPHTTVGALKLVIA